jgi:hypothetical protein
VLLRLIASPPYGTHGAMTPSSRGPGDVETWDSRAMSPGSWAAEEIAKLVPEGAPVVKVFNTTVAGTLGVQLTNRNVCNETGTHRSRCGRWACGRGGL